ncbi:MAG: DUF4394 domain-containing protein [Pseudomonadota bacterium]
MMKRFLGFAAALTLAATPAVAGGHAGTMGYALANDGKTLAVMVDIAKPTKLRTYDLAQPLAAIAYRPVTGDLLGFTNGKIFTVDPSSGKLTDLGAKFTDSTEISGDAAIAFDFNNKIDAVRAVSSNGDNLVYFPIGFGDNDQRANSVLRFTNLAYEDGDNSAGTDPVVFANAYTNAINGKKASGTFQYALDARANALISLANNAGTLKTVGLVKIDGQPADILPMGGFDIVSPEEGTDQAYAILQIDGQDSAGLYGIDLKTGDAALLADLGMGGFTGFAVSKQ